MPVSQLYFPYYFWFFQSVARKHKSRSFFDLCWLIHHYIFRTSEFESANNSNQISSFFFNFSRLIAFKCGQYLKRIWIEVRSIRDLLVYFNEYDDDCWSSLILIVHLSQSDKSHQSISRWWTSIIRFWDFSFCFASQSKAIIHHPRLVENKFYDDDDGLWNWNWKTKFCFSDFDQKNDQQSNMVLLSSFSMPLRSKFTVLKSIVYLRKTSQERGRER